MKIAIVAAIVAAVSLPTHVIAQQGPAPAAGSAAPGAAAPGAAATGAAAAAAPVAALAPNVALLLGAGALVGIAGIGPGNSANTPAADRPMPSGRLTPKGRPFTDPNFNPTTTTITTNTTITTAPGSF